MWSLTYRLARPSLAQHLTRAALTLNEQALRALQDDAARRPADLEDLVEAGAACWWVFRPALSKARWRAVKRCLGVQSRRALEQQSTWLAELAGAAPPAEEALLDAVARLYRKARRAVLADPTTGRAQRHLARLVRVEELMCLPAGPNHVGAGPQTGARRTLLVAMQHARRAGRGTTTKRQRRRVRRLERGLVALAPGAFAASPAAFRDTLEWRVFLALVPEPEPLEGAGRWLISTAGAD